MPPPGKTAPGNHALLSRSGQRPVAIAVAALVPLLTLALYLTHGTPGLPSYPMVGRAQAPLEQANVGELISKVEARLREHPEDGQGWDVIAPIYFKLGRYREAAAAFSSAARLEGETARRLAGFAEAAVLAADGVVGEEARLAFEKILQLEPKRPEPRFWLALAKEQDGKLADALPTTRSCWRRRRRKPRGGVQWKAALPTSRAASPARETRAAQSRAYLPRMWRRPRGSRPQIAPA